VLDYYVLQEENFNGASFELSQVSMPGSSIDLQVKFINLVSRPTNYKKSSHNVLLQHTNACSVTTDERLDVTNGSNSTDSHQSVRHNMHY